MNDHHQKGTQVNHTSRSARTPFLRTGIFAALRGVFGGGGGSGALSSGWVGGRTPALHLLSLALIVTAFLALSAAPASAAPPTQFGFEGESAGGFIEPNGIAADQSTGDTYIGDRNNARVDKFGPEGESLLAFGWSVADPNIAALQTCTTSCFTGKFGAGPGQFSKPEGVAVDPISGDLYVLDRGNHRVQKFTSGGEFLLMLGGGVDEGPNHPGNLCTAAYLAAGDTCGAGAEEGTGPGEFNRVSRRAISVGPGGNLFVGDIERVQRFSPEGALEAAFAVPGSGFIENLAVDSAGNIYIQSEGLTGVRKYDGAGTELGTPRDEAGRPGPLAIGPADRLFAFDRESEHILAFDPAGELLSSTASPGGAVALAYGEAAGALFVLQQQQVRLLAPATPGAPYIVNQSATEIGTRTATLNATLNPEGGEETTYHFEYGTTTAYGQETAATELTGAAFEDQPALAAISGLSARTTYHFRVVATNKAGETTTGPDQSFETLPPVSIDSTSASAVSATTATLEAQLNPHGLSTTYHFEYDTAPYTEGGGPHGESTPTASAGSGTTDVLRSVLVSGLAPNTTYHFRVVAENELGAVQGPDSTFTTQGQASPLLPDSRGWELVTPPLKNGNAVDLPSSEGGIIQAAADGSGLIYVAVGPVGSGVEGNRNIALTQLLSTRTADGSWGTLDLSSPHQQAAGLIQGEPSEYRQFSPDLATAALMPAGATPLSPEATEKTPYLRSPSGAYVPLLTAANVREGVHFGGIDPELGPEGSAKIEAASPDLQTVIISSEQPLTAPLESPGPQSLFAWRAGRLELASVLPDGTSAASHKLLAGVGNVVSEKTIGAVSNDGNRLIFQTGDNALYLRDLARGLTARVDVSEAGLPAQPVGRVEFQAASADGSRIYFTDTAQLSEYSHASEQKPDLYLCQLEEVGGQPHCDVTDVSRVTESSERAAVQVPSIPGTSSSGRYVYFVADGVLAPGASPGSCEGDERSELRACNLYVADAQTGQTHFIARLTMEDSPNWGGGIVGQRGRGSVVSEVSPDGMYASFMSSSPLTGYDNRDIHSGARDEEVFLYSLATGKVTCVSCNRSGARPNGVFATSEPPQILVERNRNWLGQWLAGSTTSGVRADVVNSYYQPRFLGDSGRLFFNSPDALVPADSNGKEDVYEYEPAGVGSCSEAAGCVSLISSGTSPEESAFLDASESGDDAFFLTASRLTPKDVDGAYDVYDAHVGGGEPEVIKPVECSGDACQQPATPPTDASPGSLTFNGAGNVKACPKGKKLKKGKCVKKKARKHHKKSNKKKGKKHKNKRTNVNRGGAK
jgi:sugar lactone lactonase YvrE